MGEVGIGRPHVAAPRQLDEDRAEVARVVFDPHRSARLADQVRERPVVVGDAEQVHAVAAHHPFLPGQEIQHEGVLVPRQPERGSRDPVGPGCSRRFAQCRMHVVVVRAEHLQSEHALELGQAQHRLAFGWVVGALGDA